MKKFDQINVIPFIDIMLVLLAIVLMTATFISKGKIDVAIPQSNSEVKLKQADIVKLLTITKEGKFYRDGELVTAEQLDKLLATWDKQEKITLKVDAGVPFQKFIDMTDILNRHQLKKVAVVTLKTKQVN